MKQTLLLIISLLFATLLSAQSWEDLSIKEQKRIARIWNNKNPSTKLTETDKTIQSGQVIYQTDSGIVLRTSPQYLSYTDSSVRFVPFRDIYRLDIKQPARLKENLLAGAMIGGYFSSSISLALPFNSGAVSSNRHGSVRIAYFVSGALTGMLISLLKSSKDHKDYQLYFDENPYFQSSHFLQIDKGALYRQAKIPTKNTIPQDSILKGHELPYELGKLKPKHKGLKLQISISEGQTDVWGQESISPKTPETNSALIDIWSETYGNYFLSRTPSFYEMRGLYNITPWFKVGIQTHKIQDDLNKFSSSSNLDFLYFDGVRNLKHNRAWGPVIEFTPFPTKFLMLRRWDINLGGGIFRQGLEISDTYELKYFGPFAIEKNTIGRTGKYTYWSALAYGGISFYLLPNLSFQAKIGQYYAPSYDLDGFSIGLDVLQNDIDISPTSYKLSWSYYSFGVNLHL